MYYLYGQNKYGSWKFIDSNLQLEKMQIAGQNLLPDDYTTYMIINKSKQGDEVMERQDIKNNKQTKAQQFRNRIKIDIEQHNNKRPKKSSKAQEKEELRKLTEDYIDR